MSFRDFGDREGSLGLRELHEVATRAACLHLARYSLQRFIADLVRLESLTYMELRQAGKPDLRGISLTLWVVPPLSL